MIDACFDVKYTQVDGSQHTTHMLVLECALCSVYDLVSRSGPFREPHARYWFQQLVQVCFVIYLAVCVEGLWINIEHFSIRKLFH